MKISDGAVDTVQLWTWEKYTSPVNNLGWGPIEGIIGRALTYYAEHPDELPEDVAQAVRNMDAAEAEKAFQSMMAYRAEHGSERR